MSNIVRTTTDAQWKVSREVMQDAERVKKMAELAKQLASPNNPFDSIGCLADHNKQCWVLLHRKGQIDEWVSEHILGKVSKTLLKAILFDPSPNQKKKTDLSAAASTAGILLSGKRKELEELQEKHEQLKKDLHSTRVATRKLLAEVSELQNSQQERARNIQRLEKMIAQQKGRIFELEQANKASEGTQEKLKAKEEQLKQAQAALITEHTQQANLSQRLAKTDKELVEAQSRMSDLEKRLAESQQTLATSQERIQQLSREHAEAQKGCREAQAEASDLKAKLERTNQQFNSDLAEQTRLTIQANKSVEHLQSEIKKVQKEHADLQQQLQEARTHNDQTAAQLKTARADCNAAQQKVNGMETTISRLEQTNKASESLRADQAKELANAREDLDKAVKNQEALKARVAELETAVNQQQVQIKASEQELGTLRDREQRLSQELVASQSQQAALIPKEAELRRTHEQLVTETEKLKNDLTGSNIRAEQLETKLKELNQQINTLSENRQAAEKRGREITEQLNAREQDNQALKEKIAILTKERMALEEETERLSIDNNREKSSSASLKKRLAEAEQQVQIKREDLKQAEEALQQGKVLCEQLKSLLAHQGQQSASLQKQQKLLSEKQAKLEQEKNEVERQREQLKQEISGLQKKLDVVSEQLKQEQANALRQTAVLEQQILRLQQTIDANGKANAEEVLRIQQEHSKKLKELGAQHEQQLKKLDKEKEKALAESESQSKERIARLEREMDRLRNQLTEKDQEFAASSKQATLSNQRLQGLIQERDASANTTKAQLEQLQKELATAQAELIHQKKEALLQKSQMEEQHRKDILRIEQERNAKLEELRAHYAEELEKASEQARIYHNAWARILGEKAQASVLYTKAQQQVVALEKQLAAATQELEAQQKKQAEGGNLELEQTIAALKKQHIEAVLRMGIHQRRLTKAYQGQLQGLIAMYEGKLKQQALTQVQQQQASEVLLQQRDATIKEAARHIDILASALEQQEMSLTAAKNEEQRLLKDNSLLLNESFSLRDQVFNLSRVEEAPKEDPQIGVLKTQLQLKTDQIKALEKEISAYQQEAQATQAPLQELQRTQLARKQERLAHEEQIKVLNQRIAEIESEALRLVQARRAEEEARHQKLTNDLAIMEQGQQAAIQRLEETLARQTQQLEGEQAAHAKTLDSLRFLQRTTLPLKPYIPQLKQGFAGLAVALQEAIASSAPPSKK